MIDPTQAEEEPRGIIILPTKWSQKEAQKASEWLKGQPPITFAEALRRADGEGWAIAIWGEFFCPEEIRVVTDPILSSEILVRVTV